MCEAEAGGGRRFHENADFSNQARKLQGGREMGLGRAGPCRRFMRAGERHMKLPVLEHQWIAPPFDVLDLTRCAAGCALSAGWFIFWRAVSVQIFDALVGELVECR